MPDPTLTTRLLHAATEGNRQAAEDLLPHVYDELRRIAGRLMQDHGSGHTLQPTAIIHEAYVRLAHGEDEHWEGRRHFVRVAAKAMRNVLVDYARARSADKRGGARQRVTLDTQVSAIAEDPEQLLELHDMLERLADIDAQLAQVAELRLFGGLTVPEIAHALGVSASSVDRAWRLARAWWIQEIEAEEA